MENTDLRDILKSCSNKWVALSSNSSKVVGISDNVSGAIEQAHLNNEDEPILTMVTEHYDTFVL